MQTKYLFITGGVCSSLGKGLTAASIGMLLEKKGLKIAMLKLDPYLNVDPGTMSPYQHGEVYVTDDGAETDLDLGHYYRYTNSPLSKASNTTSGQIYNTVIRRERQGDYLGKTVQVIPHITDEIKQRIYACAKQEENIDVVLVEIGGTVGDIESLPFLEAIRQFRNENRGSCLNIHLTYVPYLKAAGEVKTKPSQHSVQVLREIGIFADIIICRCEKTLPEDVKDKLSLFCNVSRKAVIEEVDVEFSIYEVPLKLHEQNIDAMICEMLGLPDKTIDMSDWEKILETLRHPKGTIKVGVIGKYVQHQDAYKSVFESLHHGALSLGYKLEIKRYEADKLLEEGANLEKIIEGCDGYLVPGGFGERGWMGKIYSAKYCRENHIPYFGICLGMQVMAVEFARHVAKLEEANTTEVDPFTKNPVISLLSEQKEVQEMGGTMRLGAFTCNLVRGSKAHAAYKADKISERHRHRYEFNNKYKEQMEDAGFLISGTLDHSTLCEIAEVKDHPWMVGVQFHPEFKSKPTEAHPLFKAFVQAMIDYKNKQHHE
ncbi:MAG: CTP synthase [Chlamydiales bacterium 38-26]|nr:CTP synthase [Chlamydiales bacterium]OJV07228.1 MAG: CTP synthase [Chlamydiales bacterium 38-26]